MNQRPLKSVFRLALAPAILTLVLLAITPPAFSQIVDSGRISGTVSDVSGAVVGSAPVTFLNTATGLSDKAVTESSGLFVSPPLPPGDYDVTVEVAGFNKEVQHVRLEVAQRAALTITLSPGKATETVNVGAAAPLLAAETTTLSNLRTETSRETTRP
jgi:hypothetical protein